MEKCCIRCVYCYTVCEDLDDEWDFPHEYEACTINDIPDTASPHFYSCEYFMSIEDFKTIKRQA